ncbi:MAG: ribulose-phosphate 3-epimerase [Mycoplasma sp.]
MSKSHKLEVSILAFDTSSNKKFTNQLRLMKKSGIKIVHYDVMDHIFVPNSAYGTEYLRQLFLMNFEVNIHFMVADPWKWVKEFLYFPNNAITFHPEPVSKLSAYFLIRKIQKAKRLAGLAFRPETDLTKYKWLLKKSDIVTIMGVNPGFGGQKFMTDITLKNLKVLNEIKRRYNPELIVQLDGGVNYQVMGLTKDYVDNFISGSFLVKQPKPAEVLKFVKNL